MRLPSGTFAQTYGQDMGLVRTKSNWIALVVMAAFVFTIPQWASNSTLTLVTVMCMTIIAAHGLNILTGNCGLVSMGHSGFMMVGGYAMAILGTRWGIPFLPGIILSGLIAGVIGILFGLPSLRIKGFYLIMATVAAYFIIHWLILQFRGVTGATEGISMPMPEPVRLVAQTQGALLLRRCGAGHSGDGRREEHSAHPRRDALSWPSATTTWRPR